MVSKNLSKNVKNSLKSIAVDVFYDCMQQNEARNYLKWSKFTLHFVLTATPELAQ